MRQENPNYLVQVEGWRGAVRLPDLAYPMICPPPTARPAAEEEPAEEPVGELVAA